MNHYYHYYHYYHIITCNKIFNFLLLSFFLSLSFTSFLLQYVGKGRGQCFKAYPTCFSSKSNTSDIRKTLSQAAAARDVIFSPQKSTTRFSVRVKIFSYPAGIYALWIMIAVRFDGKSSE